MENVYRFSSGHLKTEREKMRTIVKIKIMKSAKPTHERTLLIDAVCYKIKIYNYTPGAFSKTT